MKRRICESCYFYESAGIANSGWCRHPDRQFSTGVRLVVRGSELNCRNGWDIDLWVPAGIEPGADDDFSAEPPPIAPQDDQITSIVPARYERQQPAEAVPAESEDVVVRHAPYADYSPPEKEARDLVTNPRAAILKAREQFKVKQLREGRIADHIERPILADSADDFSDLSPNGGLQVQSGDQDDRRQENAPFLGTGAPGARRTPEFTVPPVTRNEINRPYLTITHFPEDDERFESLPDEIVDLPIQQAAEDQPLFAEPDLQLEPYDDSFDDWVGDELLAENGVPAGNPKIRRKSIVERLLGDRRRRRQPAFDERLIDDEHIASAFEYDEIHDPQPNEQPFSVQQFEQYPVPSRDTEYPVQPPYLDNERPRLYGHRSARQPDHRGRHNPTPVVSQDDLEWAMAPFDEPEYVYRGGQEERREVIPPSRYEPSPQRRTDAEHFQMDSYAPLDSDYAYYPPAGAWDDLPQWNGSNAGARDYLPPVQSGRAGRTIDPNLPHICRTCRDFRPTESGDRGWCNNAYAFMHRRMVDADVLSCESSFGNWWLAHDGVWQKTADVSRHALETPLLDRLLGIQDYADPPHRSGSGR